MTRPPAAPVVRYGSHPDQVANLHLPSGSGPFRPVVLLHGGFWRDRWDRTLMTPLAHDLASRGFAAGNVEYRRVGQDGGGWPGTLEDVEAAVERLAEEPEIGAEAIVVVGHSAGGQLALWVASRSRRIRLAGVVGLAAVSDLERARRFNAEAVDAFLGGPPERVPERYGAASPAALVPLGVRQVLVHGERDDVVPPWLSEEYAAAARDAGDEVELHVAPGADHFDVIDPRHPAWELAADSIDRLLVGR